MKISKSKLAIMMIEYEEGRLSTDQKIELLQELVNNGMAWVLQGSYGRTAQALIDQGYIQAKETK